MSLTNALEGKEYVVQDINTNDEELKSFLFSLGCYSGEKITIVSRKRKNFVVSIKDARYNIDNQLTDAIMIQQLIIPDITIGFYMVHRLASANTE